MVTCCTTTKCILYRGIIGRYAMVTDACSMVSSQAINNSLCTMVCSPLAKHRISLTQAGLVLRQGYIPEKCRANQNCAKWTQNSHWKQCISWGLRDWQPHLYSVRLYHYWTSGPVEYSLTIYTVHTQFYTIYLFIYNVIKM